MSLFCLLFGCTWRPHRMLKLGGEPFILEICERCPACRYRIQG